VPSALQVLVGVPPVPTEQVPLALVSERVAGKEMPSTVSAGQTARWHEESSAPQEPSMLQVLVGVPW